MAVPASALADTPANAHKSPSGISAAVDHVRAHTDRADSALDRAVSLFAKNSDRKARVAYAKSRKEMGLAKALTGSGVSKVNKRRVAATLKVDVEGQPDAAQTLAALIESSGMPAESKQGLQTAYDDVTAEHGSITDILSRFSSRMPSFVRDFVTKIITQARTDAQGMRDNHPTGAPGGAPTGTPIPTP